MGDVGIVFNNVVYPSKEVCNFYIDITPSNGLFNTYSETVRMVRNHIQTVFYQDRKDELPPNC